MGAEAVAEASLLARHQTLYSNNQHDSGTLKDPLDLLTPSSLSSSSLHLHNLPLTHLFRAYLVFLASGSATLVDYAPSAVSAFETLRDTLPFGLGQLVWRGFLFSMRHTFFAQFVAGESVTDTYPLLEKLYAQNHCGAMLNWGAEAEHASLTPSEAASEQSMVMDEAMGELWRAVQAAGEFRHDLAIKPTILAIKPTGLVKDPTVFERGTEAILASTAAARGQLVPSNIPDSIVPDSPHLTPADLATFKGLDEFLRALCALAKERGVRLAFDAEQSWFQPCLDVLVTRLQREFNVPSPQERTSVPLVYNTYQANLRGCEGALKRDLADARERGYSLGVKLVRGAYVVSENARAAKSGALSKAWSSKAESDACFDKCSEIILEQVVEDLNREQEARDGKARAGGPSAVFATHNAASTRRSLEYLRSRGMVRNSGQDHLDIDDRIRGRVGFAQLLAMADSLTAAMSQLFPPPPESRESDKAGLLPINSLYVPYGKIDLVMPYLVRRAQENKSILQGSDGSGRGGAAEQRRAVGREIRRRLFPGLF